MFLLHSEIPLNPRNISIHITINTKYDNFFIVVPFHLNSGKISAKAVYNKPHDIRDKTYDSLETKKSANGKVRIAPKRPQIAAKYAYFISL